MEITPSPSAYHSKFVTKKISQKLLIWDLKVNFWRLPSEINLKNINIFLINPTVHM